MNRLPTPLLFALAVLIWGTTWHAIVHQLSHLSPEAGVAIRFTLAAGIVLAFAAARGERLRLPPRVHAALAFQGVFMYGVSYVAVYHAERHVASGLVAVGYSASPLVAGIGAWWLGDSPRPSRRFVLGGALAVGGVALLFAPELAAMARGDPSGPPGGDPLLGLVFTVAAVLLSTVGALAANRIGARGLPFWPAMGFGMAWGAASVWAWLAVSGGALPWPLPAAAAWWASLGWLTIAGTVVAFAAFLVLQQRVGPGRAAAIGAMTPVVALVVSALFEAWTPTLAAFAGAALAIAGNRLILVPAAGAPRAAATPAGDRAAG